MRTGSTPADSAPPPGVVLIRDRSTLPLADTSLWNALIAGVKLPRTSLLTRKGMVVSAGIASRRSADGSYVRKTEAPAMRCPAGVR